MLEEMVVREGERIREGRRGFYVHKNTGGYCTHLRCDTKIPGLSGQNPVNIRGEVFARAVGRISCYA